MAQADNRMTASPSRAEMERRWRLAREAMASLGVDALVVQGAANLAGTGGYFRWLNGMVPLTSYPQTAIIPAQGALTLVAHGGFGAKIELDGNDPVMPGVGTRLGTPSFPAIAYTGTYDADLAAGAIREAGYKTVGLVGTNSSYYGLIARLKEQLAGVRVVDATAAIDPLRAIKSAEEIDLLRRAAAMQDEMLTKVRDFIRPGVHDFEVMAYADYIGQQLGSETGYMLGSSAPPGQPAMLRPRPQQGRKINAGDVVLVQAENTGPAGYFTHVARFFVLGKTPPDLKQVYAALVTAQGYTVDLLKPGASCADIFARYNDYMCMQGFAPETRLHCHSQGYDAVERPLIRNDEDMTIAPHMNIGIHPSVMTRTLFATVCDNFLTLPDGGVERLHKIPQDIVEL
jgi:Xaa-Pro aminopeptidase